MSAPDLARSPSVLLLDADGTLFASEEPAFDASAFVTQAFAEWYGLRGDFSAETLLRTTTGVNFRTTAGRLLAEAGVEAAPDEFELWVQKEKAAVSSHLAEVLRPDPDVLRVLRAAASDQLVLAAVSSSALSRLDACFTASGLAELIPPARRFSAEDSLPVPTSKPDPAVYLHALRTLGAEPADAVAVEDSTTGARSAVAAGIDTVGIVAFVPPELRAEREAELLAVGVSRVVSDWPALGHLLGPAVSGIEPSARTRATPSSQGDARR